MKNFLPFVLLLGFQSFFCGAQSGQWIWMKGDSTPDPIAHYGTLGVEDPLNVPPGLYEAINWTDNDGNFWLFGGINYTTLSYNSALWKFNPSTNNWTWMNGSSSLNMPGTYGTQGIPDPNNSPGARAWGAASWTDSTGNLWLFAGYGNDSQGSVGQLNDVWKYDIATNEWTWMRGSKFTYGPFSYGTQGVEDPTNDPTARDEAVGAWKGKNNFLWYFGGFDGDDKNDLWRYNINTNNWTWMTGSNGSGGNPSYGTLGVESSFNDPGGRSVYSRWTDCDGNLWFFGGAMISSASSRNDVWKYNPLTNYWTWMHGSSSLNNAVAVAGNNCEFDSSFYPAARYESRACWRDTHGNFWMFGGFTLSGTYGDLWVYKPNVNEWAFVSGSLLQSQNGFYGQQGVSNPSNFPSGKMGPVSWLDHDGNLWLFGGNKKVPFNILSMNDVWKYIPDSSCTGNFNIICEVVPAPAFVASATEVCQKFCTDFTDESTNEPTAWQWIFQGGTPATSSEQNPTNICYNLPGTYDVTLITTNANGNDTLTLSNYITVNPTPPIPLITQNGNILASSIAPFYQWQLNTIDIPGATNQSFTVTQTGFYTVVVSDSNSCQNSATLYVELTGVANVNNALDVSIYPNVSSGNFTLEISGNLHEAEITLLNTLGQNIFSEREENLSGHFIKSFDFSALPSAIYFVEVKTGVEKVTMKIVKQ